MPDKKALPVVEIFDSVQGEGPFIHPAVFLRTALCNLSCKGFNCSLSAPDGSVVYGCDTIRAVSVKFKDSWDYFSDSDSLIKALTAHKRVYLLTPHRKQDLVVTGGEPLLHFNNPVLTETVKHFINDSHRVIIETNASVDKPYIYENEILKLIKDCTFSMSVKLASSGESFDKRVKRELIDYLYENSKESYLKFVVSKDNFESDIKEISKILSSLKNDIPVYLMPLGKNREELQANCAFVLEKCIEYGFNYTDRIHIRAFNTKECV